ncbi:MAG: hybrid sensor histidine kinase/response regulator [Lachnospiraceae bacterium]|nr:hybrid sensor histidine kinase/response regulator [Lachnospiraceae bacterium]
MSERQEKDVLISVLARVYEKIFLLDNRARCGYVLDEDGRTEVTDFDKWCDENYGRCYAGDDIGSFLENIKSEMLLEALTYENDYVLECPMFEAGEIRRKRFVVFFCGEETICVCQSDVTEQFEKECDKNRLVEKCLELAQQANIEKEKTWKNMGEEIRVPFYEASEMLSMALEDDSKQKEYLQKAKCAMDNYREMFEQMFTLSAIEKGEEFEQSDMILPEKLLQTLQQIAELKMGDAGVTWKMSNLSPQVSTFISDSARLYQLLYNVMIAVAEVADDKTPEVVLDFDIAKAQEDVDDESDEIPLPGIFDLRFRIYAKADPQRIQSHERMSYIYRLTEFMSVVLGFEESDGRTEIKLTIPVQEADRYEQSEAGIVSHLVDNIHNKDFSMYRALVVDDDEISKEIIVSKLKQFGLNVDTAEDGQEAIDMLVASEEDYYQIMFMKMMLPKKSGLEATMEIREMDRGDLNDITIVAVTANELRDKRIHALEHGMDHHLILPFNDFSIREILVRELQDLSPRDDHEKFGFRVVK